MLIFKLSVFLNFFLFWQIIKKYDSSCWYQEAGWYPTYARIQNMQGRKFCLCGIYFSCFETGVWSGKQTDYNLLHCLQLMTDKCSLIIIKADGHLKHNTQLSPRFLWFVKILQLAKLQSCIWKHTVWFLYPVSSKPSELHVGSVFSSSIISLAGYSKCFMKCCVLV